MPFIIKIDCKIKENTEDFIYLPSIFSKNSNIDNISMFEDLNINQISIKKTDFY